MASGKERRYSPLQARSENIFYLGLGLECKPPITKQKLLAVGNAAFPLYWSILKENRPELGLADRKDFPLATDFSVSEITFNSGIQAKIALTFIADNGIENSFLGGYMHDVEGEVVWFAVRVGFEYTQQLVETFAEFFINELLNPLCKGEGILIWNRLPE